jgi:3-oxoadipyl-CoA thiolase
MKDVYITYAQRSAIGSFNGSLSSVRVDDLLAQLFTHFKQNTTFELELIDDIIVGCANQAGEDNRNLARMSALLANLPQSIAATTINRLCGSSLDAIMGAYARISSGLADAILVGGAESMSRAPYVLSKAHSSYDRTQQMWDTSIGWRFPNPKMAEMFPLLGMGETAEVVRKKLNISRMQQDEFAFNSHQKALKAIKSGAFKNEIVPIEVKHKKNTIVFDTDEGVRTDTSLEKLATLKPAFEANGTVTAGNSSSINDGASVVFVASEDFIKKNNLTPIVKITAAAVAGLHPNEMGLGPVHATKKLMTKFNYKINQFDLIELNEAFAAQALGCIKELELDPSKINLNGGAIALGHPLGCSGARISTTLIHLMVKNPQYKIGLATMCIGVGQGIAVSFENMN